MDAIYTPQDLAEQLVLASSQRKPHSVADFSAGDGALLNAARSRWPNITLYGSDIDPEAVEHLKARFEDCECQVRDFLADDILSKPSSGKNGSDFNLILLNPPFSSRQKATFPVQLNGKIFQGSKALTFVARSLELVTDCGEVIAILPASVLTSERDMELMRELQSTFDVRQVGGINEIAFRSHDVAIVILCITRQAPRKRRQKKKVTKLEHNAGYSVYMKRGTLPVDGISSSPSGVRFVHTTNLKNGKLCACKRVSGETKSLVEGPAILLPRVGRPSKYKIALLDAEIVALSDCVFSIKTKPEGNEEALMKIMVENWSLIEAAYGGSCAKYTTYRRLGAALAGLGFSHKKD